MDTSEINLAFFFEIIGVFVTMIVLKIQFLFSKWFNFANPAKKELMERFDRLWDGNAESRYHTWLKVKIGADQFDSNPEHHKLLREILEKEEKHQPTSQYSIDEKGKIVSRKAHSKLKTH